MARQLPERISAPPFWCHLLSSSCLLVTGSFRLSPCSSSHPVLPAALSVCLRLSHLLLLPGQTAVDSGVKTPSGGGRPGPSVGFTIRSPLNDVPLVLSASENRRGQRGQPVRRSVRPCLQLLPSPRMRLPREHLHTQNPERKRKIKSAAQSYRKGCHGNRLPCLRG